ncbi:MAG: hypothetical protein AAF525_04680 [Pseudomonadota bacterium]
MTDINGTWQLIIETPMGKREPKLTLTTDGDRVSGTFAGQMGSTDFTDGQVDGNSVDISVDLNAMGQTIHLNLVATIEGDRLSGQVTTPQGQIQVTGVRA